MSTLMNSEDDSYWCGFNSDTRIQHTTPNQQCSSAQVFSNHSEKIESDDLFINIEDHLISRIIGKCVKRIKFFKKISGASISFEDVNDFGQRPIKISGDAKAKELALKLINDMLMQYTEIPKKIIEQKIKEAVDECIYTKPPLIYHFCKEHPFVPMMRNQEIKENITVKHIDEKNMKPIPKPVLKFSQAFKDYPEILKKIQKQQFKTPLPIQCHAWPIIMSGYDLIAVSQTGTGKTLCFLLPAFIHINSQTTHRDARKGPSVLVLVPTRELVLQIASEVKKYSYKGIKALSIYGGVSFEKQKRSLQNKIEFVIATPGRLQHFVECGAINLSDVTLLIFDEADHMMGSGFEQQIRVLITKLSKDRQTIMTSATWSHGGTCFAKNYMNNPIQVNVGSLDLATVNTIKQEIFIIKEEEKGFWLDELMKNLGKNDKVIIFLNCKRAVNWISTDLREKGYNIQYIHGNRKQRDREKALKRLHDGEISILIATDVVSRGIDINNITVVINYDFPKNIEEYVHRIGRTGRSGKTGLAITFMTENDWDKAKSLIELMKKSGQYISPRLQAMATRFETHEAQNLVDRYARLFRDEGDGNDEGDFFF